MCILKFLTCYIVILLSLLALKTHDSSKEHALIDFMVSQGEEKLATFCGFFEEGFERSHLISSLSEHLDKFQSEPVIFWLTLVFP